MSYYTQYETLLNLTDTETTTFQGICSELPVAWSERLFKYLTNMMPPAQNGFPKLQNDQILQTKEGGQDG